MKTNVIERRKMRELEAKRDRLMEQAQKSKVQLAETRAAMKAMRARRRT